MTDTLERLDRLREMRAWVDQEIAHEVERISPAAQGILSDVCALYGVETADVLSGSRRQQEVRARQGAAWMLRRTGLSFYRIGAALGCDHSTAIYAVRKIEKDASTRSLLLGLGRAVIV